MSGVNVFQEWMSKATLFDWATNLSAFLAMLFLLLVIYGFRRYVRRPRTEAIDFIGTGIWIMALDHMLRLLWWDVAPDLLGMRWTEGLGGTNVNWAFNLFMCVGAWFVLKGFHILVEARAPGQYTVWTAVFYPKRLKLSLIGRKGIDE